MDEREREREGEEGRSIANKVANRSNLFFPTPPPTDFLLPSCSAPSRADPLKTKYSLVNFLGFREKSVAREKRA